MHGASMQTLSGVWKQQMEKEQKVVSCFCRQRNERTEKAAAIPPRKTIFCRSGASLKMSTKRFFKKRDTTDKPSQALKKRDRTVVNDVHSNAIYDYKLQAIHNKYLNFKQ